MATQSSQLVNGAYGASYKSVYDNNFPPEVWGKLYQRFGEGFKVNDFLYLAGRTANVAQPTWFHLEEQAWERPIKLADNGSGDGVSVAAAGADITFKLDASMYDTNGNAPIRIGFSVLIPRSYLATAINGLPREYRVMSKANTGAATVYTAKPLKSDSEIATAIPVGTELILGASSFARGTGQPESQTTALLKLEHATRIYKDRVAWEGGIIGNRTYEEDLEGGYASYYDRGVAELDFRIDKQIDRGVFISDNNTNSVTQTSSITGATNSVVTGKGLINWMDERSQELYYTTWDITDHDRIKTLLTSQGETSKTCLFGVGEDLYLGAENATLDHVRDYSQGSDLIDNMNKAGIAFKAVEKNGITLILTEMRSFSNPNAYGSDAYDFKKWGFIIPMSEVKVQYQNEGITVPNLALAYYNNKGENRSRIIQERAGINGLGKQATNEYDGLYLEALCEAGLFAANMNRNILVRPQ